MYKVFLSAGEVDEPFCNENLQFNETMGGGFYTENICSCFKDNCNAPENDAKMPLLSPKSLKCVAEACIGNKCVNATGNSCSGQYCYERKIL